MFELKFYAAIFVLVIGFSTIFNQTAQGQTIINPSFETDNVPAPPGYGAITGWTGGSGINAANGPFTDNGTIPDGQKAAFLQGGGALRQTVQGFTIGTTYRLRYYENARSCCAPRTAILHVTVGGVPVVPTHEVVSVGGSNPYVLKVSEPFTATAEAQEIAFITGGTGDYTVLLDKIEVGRNLVVTNGNDSGPGSLRQAVVDAPAGGIITFSDSMLREIALTTDQILIDKNLTIAGPGAENLTVRNGAAPGVNFRIFEVASGITAAISGLAISDGKVAGGIAGGGILNIGNLTLSNSTVTGNVTQFRGGGIYNAGNLTVINSSITENFAAEDGGGIYSHRGTVIITDSTVSLNIGGNGDTGGKGGGIFIAKDTLELTDSSLIRNLATNSSNNASGGGLFIVADNLGDPGGSATLTNSTVSGNSVNLCTLPDPSSCTPGFSNGISGGGSLTLTNSTVADNILGTYNARNSILAGNTHGTLISLGYNLIENNDGTTITGDTTGNIVGTNTAPIDARLSSLGFYGGPTQTHALLTGSPAINTSNTATSPATDQRGAARVGTADIGAFELNNAANGGAFRAQLPDGFIHNAYNYTLVPESGGFTYSLTGGTLPTGISLSTSGTVNGTTDQTGDFNFSVTTTDGTNSLVTDYSVRFLYREPSPGGCISNPVVLNGLDSGAGTLRQVVIDACPGSTITFRDSMPPTLLTTGEITIGKDLTIAGPGANVLTIIPKTGSLVTGFGVHSGVTAAISGLTISAGDVGIKNHGNLTVASSTVSYNKRGGGIDNGGNLTVVNSIIRQNGDGSILATSGRGGINSWGASLTIVNSTITENYRRDGGGGIRSENLLTITGSTISSNFTSGNSDCFSAGLWNLGTATLTNSTVSDNLISNCSFGLGAGIYNEGTLSLVNSTVAKNRISGNSGSDQIGIGAGIINDFYALGGRTVTARNSIIAGNTSAGGSFIFFAPDFYGTLTSHGYNLIGNTEETTIEGDTTGNIVNTDARLAWLGFYGGPTQTVALLSGSPAINAGNTATSPATDQRGAGRVDTADIGAFELNNSANGGTFVAQVPDGVVQSAYSYTLGGGGATRSMTGGELPTGLSLSTDGAVSGTPTVSGVFNFSVTATDGTNSFVANYRLQIHALPTGSFDSADCSSFYGWAWDPQQPNTPISVNIYADDNLVATVPANQFRQDLLDAGIGNGVHAFSLATPANLKDGQPHQIRVQIVSTLSEINGSPKTITCSAPVYSISGTVIYGTTNIGQPDSFVSAVNLNATGSASALAISDASGIYQLSDLISGGSYTVTPTKTGEVRGINSLDATRIQQHLVGMTTLSANQLIAADTDGNGIANSLDATRIQQRAVGIQTTNIIGQWKFVPGSRQYNALGSNATAQDYQAVLVGEVSGNWATATSFAEDFQAEENEVLPEAADQYQLTERFGNDLSGQFTDDFSQSSDSSANESTTESLGGIGTDIQVSLPTNARRSTGSTVTIPITIGAIPVGSPIESFDFSVFYDPAVLQPSSPAGSSVGTLSVNCSVLSNSPVSGRVIVSGACAQAITTGSGVLYNLTFNVIGTINQTSSLSFTNPGNSTNTFQFNNGEPAALTTNGLFTVLAPTAAAVSVSGRVLTGEGSGLMKAIVVLTDLNGNTRSVPTGSLGYFRFDNVEAGRTYIFSVTSKRYTFEPQTVTVMDELTDLNFVAW